MLPEMRAYSDQMQLPEQSACSLLLQPEHEFIVAASSYQLHHGLPQFYLKKTD